MNRPSASLSPRRSPWWVPIGSGISGAVSGGPLILTTFSLFVIPIASETGWSRATVLGAFTVTAIGMGIGAPVVGILLDRFALRSILIPSWILYGLSIALIFATPRTLPLFYLPYLLVGLFASGTLIPLSKAVLSWFDNRRGAAIGLTASVAAIGSTLTPLLAGFLVSRVGWRQAYPWMGLVAVVVGLLAVVVFVRVRAERSSHGRLITVITGDDQSVSLDLPGLGIREAVTGRHFWIIAGSLCLAGIAVLGIQVNIVPMMIDQGLASADAALLLTIFAMGSLVGRIAGGLLLDRVDARIVGAVALLCPVVGTFFLHAPFWAAAVGVTLVGVAFGTEIDLLAFLISRYLGMRRFGSLLGVIQSATIFSTAVGPLLVGIGYDVQGSYAGVMTLLAGVLVLCAISVSLLGPYRYPAVPGFDDAAARDEPAAAETLARLAQAEHVPGAVRDAVEVPGAIR